MTIELLLSIIVVVIVVLVIIALVDRIPANDSMKTLVKVAVAILTALWIITQVRGPDWFSL